MSARLGVYASSEVLNENYFLIWFFYEKGVLMSLSNFALKKVSVCRFSKNIFQSNQELVQMKWARE